MDFDEKMIATVIIAYVAGGVPWNWPRILSDIAQTGRSDGWRHNVEKLINAPLGEDNISRILSGKIPALYGGGNYGTA
jgi:hypothetical protein